jgi:uncharacterized membrane protein YdjX (TVP38/TMEM64 family)
MPEPESPPPPGETIKELLRRLSATIWAAAFTVTVPLLGFVLLVRYNGPIIEFWRNLGDAAPAVYAVIFGAVVGAALLPTWVQAVLAGFLFGGELGACAAMTAIVIGAAIGYALAAAISGDRARRMVNEHPTWRAVEEALLESGFWRTLWVVALIRLPSTPFAMTNLVMAAVRAPLVPYILGTLLGATPRTVLWALAGRSLHSFSKEEVGKAGLPWWAFVVTVAGLVVALLVLGHIAKKAMQHMTGATAPK